MSISILRLPDVMRRTGLSRSSIFLAVKRGEFPAQIPLFGRATGWVSTEVDAWITKRIEAAR
jgi:prophage regulatory protein